MERSISFICKNNCDYRYGVIVQKFACDQFGSKSCELFKREKEYFVYFVDEPHYRNPMDGKGGTTFYTR